MNCPHCKSSKWRRKGFYYRKITRSYHRRYTCHECQKGYSVRTHSSSYRQKRPDLIPEIYKMLCSGVSLRQIALNLECSRLTVHRKCQWLSKWAVTAHQVQSLSPTQIFLDEMESIEHTKLKPLTLALAVSEKYKILGVEVGRIPAKGRLQALSLRKYGPRTDERSKTLNRLLDSISRFGASALVIKSDEHPLYPALIASQFPTLPHQRFSARRLKEKRRERLHQNQSKRVFDPLFPVNQRCALLRASLKRLARRSWCTTKSPVELKRQLDIFIAFNNGYQLPTQL